MIGAILAIASAYQAYDASRRADRAASQQGDIASEQARIGRGQLGLLRDQYRRWLETYAPLEGELVADAREGIDPERYIETAQADIGQQFGVQRENMRRQAESYGLRPDMRPGAERSLRISEALGKAGAANRTRMAVDDINWNRRMSVAGLGRGILGQAISGMGAASSSLGQAGGAYGSMANMYGNDAAAWTRLGLNLYERTRTPSTQSMPEPQQTYAGPTQYAPIYE